MSSTTPRRSSLLRASDFCQSHKTRSISVKVEVLSAVPKRQRKWNIDSVVFVPHTLLVDLSMKQGDVALLKSTGWQDGVPVVIKIAPNTMISTKTLDVIFVPPTLAAIVGCGWWNTGGSASLEPYRREIQKAHAVVVRPIGRPSRPCTLLQSRNTNPDPVQLLQKNSNKRLLAESMLISVVDPNDDLHFFEIVGIDNGVEETPVTREARAFVASVGTRWRVASFDHDGLLPRPPCLSQTQRFHQSEATEPHDDDIITTPESQLGDLHPSLHDVVRTLSVQMNSTPAQKVVHVVGTQENHVGVCVESAADKLGMRCVHVHGLAAFAHGHSDNAVSMGSLVDQIAGLHAALEQAHKCAPCVVHLADFHQELNQSDEPQRHGQEQRFWSVLMENLIVMSPAPTRDKPWWTHPVLVVISTAQALSAGPLLQNLVQRSIKLRAPNETYARQLWGSEDYEEARSYVFGLSAREIAWLKRSWKLKCETSSRLSSVERLALLDTCSKDLESQRKVVSVKIPDVHWEDVGGLSHARREIVDAIELPLRHSHLFSHPGRSGILLYGPPGTGKTLVAKAVATECGLPFLSVKGPELLGSYVGESEANVRATFAAARHAAATARVGSGSSNSQTGAAILFFDELDSLAPRRGGVGDGGGVMERVVATLLTELDGRQHDSGGATNASDKKTNVVVFVIGATNRPDLLDPSLLRPGRLDRLVYLGQAATTQHRAQILAAVMRKFKLEHNQDPFAFALQLVDQLPPSLSGADFSAIASAALLRSLRRLCDEAEAEAGQPISMPNHDAHIEQVLKTWDEERLVPMVTRDDVIEASKDAIPSVSTEELENFERLRQQFSTS